MSTILAVVIGAVVGFIVGWLVRDMATRPLVKPGERFGLGVPGEWHRRQGRRDAE